MSLKIEWVELDGSNVKRAAYHEDTQTVCVEFHSGGLYTYLGPNHEVYMGLVHANSVGQYLHRVLKAFPYTRWDNENDLADYLNVSKSVQSKK